MKSFVFMFMCCFYLLATEKHTPQNSTKADDIFYCYHKQH